MLSRTLDGLSIFEKTIVRVEVLAINTISFPGVELRNGTIKRAVLCRRSPISVGRYCLRDEFT